jgi:5-methylcytosine-specific restriction protein A
MNRTKQKTKLYNSSIWKRLRAQQLRSQPLCELCLRQNKITPATEVDHIITFEDKHDYVATCSYNLQSVCFDCHRLLSQQEPQIQKQIREYLHLHLQDKTIIDLQEEDYEKIKELKNSLFKPRRYVGVDGYPL